MPNYKNYLYYQPEKTEKIQSGETISEKKTPGFYWSLIGGTARPISGDISKLGIAPEEIQQQTFGVNSAGYDPQHGGGTTGGAQSVEQLAANIRAYDPTFGLEVPAAPVTPTPQAPFIAPIAPTSVSTPQGGDLTEGQKLWGIMGMNTSTLGSTFEGKPEQVEALKMATGGKFQFGTTPVTPPVSNTPIVSAPPAATSQLPTGMTQLTSPEQIAQYDIKGQVGKTGEAGSYLYGTPKVSDALAKTLTPSATTITAEQVSKEPTNLTGFFGEGETPDLTHIGLNLGNASINSLQQALMDTATKNQEIANQKIADAEKRQADILAGYSVLTSGEQQRKDLQTELDNAKVKESETLFNNLKNQIATKQQELSDYKLSVSAGVSKEEERIAPMEIIGRRQQKLIRDSSYHEMALTSEIATLGILAQAAQDNLTSAWRTASVFVNAVNTKYENQKDAYKMLLDLEKDKIVQLNADEKDALNKQYTTVTNQINLISKNAEDITKLITDNPIAASKIPNISLLDDPVELALKMAPYIQLEGNQKLVDAYITKFWDAGIERTDSLAVAQQKMKTSKIYLESIRPPVGGGGTLTTKYKLLEPEAQKEIDNILSGQSVWSESWNRLRQYANKSGISITNEELNILLGGEIPYEAGIWITEKATGLASAEEVKRRQQAKYKQPLGIPPENIVEETDKYIKYRDVNGNIQIQYK